MRESLAFAMLRQKEVSKREPPRVRAADLAPHSGMALPDLIFVDFDKTLTEKDTTYLLAETLVQARGSEFQASWQEHSDAYYRAYTGLIDSLLATDEISMENFFDSLHSFEIESLKTTTGLRFAHPAPTSPQRRKLT